MKQYQKPEVFYENFVLAEHIALCQLQIGSATPETCSIINDRFEDDRIDVTHAFASVKANGGPCDWTFDAYCYTNGSAGMPKIFQS